MIGSNDDVSRTLDVRISNVTLGREWQLRQNREIHKRPRTQTQKRRQKANCVTLMETIAKQVLVKANLHRMKMKAKAKNFFDVCRLFLFLAYSFTL